MKLPGTLDQLWRKLASSPVPVTSISIPTEHGPVVLTFGSPIGGESKGLVEKSPAKKPLELKPPAKKPNDAAGAFLTPPPFRQDPFAREDVA